MRQITARMFCFLATGLILWSVSGKSTCMGAPLSAIVSPKRILVLYSYNFNFPSQQQIADGLESARRTANLRSGDFVHEYLDVSSKSPELRLLIRNLLLKKYAGQTFDLIITIYDPALEFLLNEGKDLSPKTPCLALFGIERPSLNRAGQPVIQIPLHYDLRGTLELSLKLFPQTRKIFFVVGASKSDMVFEDQARDDFAPWQGKLSFDYTKNRSVDDMVTQVAHLPPQSIVIYSRVSSDITGKLFIPRDVAVRLANASTAPVFCLVSSQIDTGVVGGSVVDYETVGDIISRAEVTLLEGKLLASELLAAHYIKPMFNWRQIRHWNINVNHLPSESVFINRPPTLWGQYKKAIIGMMIAFFALISLIIALMVYNRNAMLTVEIEERKQVGKIIKSANDYNRSLIEASPDPLVTIGPDGTITDVNQATQFATGCRRDELIGTDFAEYFTEPEQARAGYRQVFQDGQVRDYALKLRCKDGKTIPVLYNASAYRDAGGEVMGVFATARDITKLRQAEEARFIAEKKLQQAKKAESLGLMAGAIAHHYNNLLAIVMGNLELSMNDLPNGSPVESSLDEAMKATRRAADLGRLMLTYLGQASGQHEMIALSETCRRSLAKLQAAIPKAVSLMTDLPSPGPIIMANAHQIHQILANLLTNAWEAIGEGRGVIHLNVKVVAPADITETRRRPLNWQPQDQSYACLEISDSGCGIAAETMDKLFDPFFSSKFTGRGLGLPVVLGIVRAHNGAVSVESGIGKGTVFRVFLPVSVEGIIRQPEISSIAPDIEMGGGVLLVEDEQDV